MSGETLEYWKDQALRHAADLDNTKKRMQKQIKEEHRKSIHSFAKDLLGVVDSLQSAREHGVEGAENTFNMFQTVFSKKGIYAFDPTEQPFDPALHEAISIQPSPSHEINIVTHCVQIGYKSENGLIRAAKVVVSSGKVEQN